MALDSHSREAALRLIEQTQSDRCASVTVQIGGVDKNGMVENDTLYIEDCPAKVVNALKNAGFSLSMTDGKLCVRIDG